MLKQDLSVTIKNIVNELRGDIDAQNFKRYASGMIFYRLISENIVKFLSDDTIDYTTVMLSDDTIEGNRRNIIKDKGFFILPHDLFVNVHLDANVEHINEVLYGVFRDIKRSAGDVLDDLFFCVNSKYIGNRKNIQLMDIVSGLNLENYFEDMTFDNIRTIRRIFEAAAAGTSLLSLTSKTRDVRYSVQDALHKGLSRAQLFCESFTSVKNIDNNSINLDIQGFACSTPYFSEHESISFRFDGSLIIRQTENGKLFIEKEDNCDHEVSQLSFWVLDGDSAETCDYKQTSELSQKDLNTLLLLIKEYLASKCFIEYGINYFNG
jgi:hypothetical protein